MSEYVGHPSEHPIIYLNSIKNIIGDDKKTPSKILLDSLDKVINELKNLPSMDGLELASKVSTKKPYFIGNPNAKYKVAIFASSEPHLALNVFFNGS